MCGRFCIAASPGDLMERYQIPIPPEYYPDYNIYPGRNVLVITCANRRFHAEMPYWGYSGLGHFIINARSETFHEKRIFKTGDTRRCIIPASGFYEWKSVQGKRHPWYIHSQSDAILSFAGITRRRGELDEVVILTTSSWEPVSDIHPRSPVILSPEQEISFLLGLDGSQVRDIRGYALTMHEVSTRVNSSSNHGADLIRPVHQRDLQSFL